MLVLTLIGIALMMCFISNSRTRHLRQIVADERAECRRRHR